MTPLDLLLWSLFIALGATGLTIILRNAPIIRGWVFELRKPWACNVCMPLYTSAALLSAPILWSRDWRLALAFPAAYLLSHLILEKMARPPASGPPPIPNMLGPDDLEDAD